MSAVETIEETIEKFVSSGEFRPKEILLELSSCVFLVKMKENPQKFTAYIFDGDWAFPSSHPTPGPIRILRVIECKDGSTRAILRQGASLYAYPFA